MKKHWTPYEKVLSEQVESLLFALKETHEEHAHLYSGSLNKHKRQEPDCDYCRRIKEAEEALKNKT
jgi:hypothetical protein